MARIILVEDDDLIRETTGELLDLIGHEVACSAAAGAAALEWIKNPGAGADLAVIDLNLPDINGDRLAGRLRETIPGLAVIISSGNRISPADLSLPPKKVSVLLKPYGLEGLQAAVAAALA